jgi:hypothetical protein
LKEFFSQTPILQPAKKSRFSNRFEVVISFPIASEEQKSRKGAKAQRRDYFKSFQCQRI